MPDHLSRLLITGGAGFVGSTIAIALKKALGLEIVAMDNLRRRGSEWILARLRDHEIRFIHGDVRCPTDFPAADFDLLIECSAEPSVLAGYHSSPHYLLDTNLIGAMNCLEFCRQHCPRMIFISTSRVYSVKALTQLPLRETTMRMELETDCLPPGVSWDGIAEDFCASSPRSLYGTTKLAAEMLVEEYRHAYGLKAVINRCGVLAGPWQMGKGDQGIFTFWLLSHYFGRPLRYIGFGGQGRQVRDLLHAQDLAELVLDQVDNFERWNGLIFNVGGGRLSNLSLRETTHFCRAITGNSPDIASEPENRPMDIPWYVTDCRRLFAHTAWRPRFSAEQILTDAFQWIRENESRVRLLF
jgi:CDP-paratose 2-epimerase